MESSGKRYFTSESVTMGHPDKVCDQISDAVVDAFIAKDKACRVACETMVKTGLVILGGEITSASHVDIPQVVRETITEIGYTDASIGFDAGSCGVILALGQQSPDIDQGVSEGKGLHKDQGAGDQGLMFGYACDETVERMPLPIALANRLVKGLTEARTSGTLPFLRPDGKTQVTVQYDGDRAVRVSTVVVSSQHSDSVSHAELSEGILEHVIRKGVPAELLDKDTVYHINPTGRFVMGGPHADCGLTGRKLIVDTYGGWSPHGGGAFSGKDPSKVDRSAAYFARYAAVNVVAAGIAQRCEIQVAYAIGVAKPVSIYVNTFGTGKVDDRKIEEVLGSTLDFRPRAMIETLDLLRPIFKDTARYGHFGRPELRWEKPDRAAELKKAAGL